MAKSWVIALYKTIAVGIAFIKAYFILKMTITHPITPASVADAHERIISHIKRTPLLSSEVLDQIASSHDPYTLLTKHDGLFNEGSSDEIAPRFRLVFKCENLQRTGAFKARGAFHALIRLVEERGLEQMRETGVTTVSSGNHAQGLALAAATLGVPATIVMPKTSTKSKIAGVARTLGIKSTNDDVNRGVYGQIRFCGSSNEEKRSAVEAVVSDTGSLFIPPYDHVDVILGQGTCAKELEVQFGEVQTPEGNKALDAVIAPIGGGGLLGGVATWFSDKPETFVFGAEPSFQGADDARRGLRQGARIDHVASATIADGLRTPVGVLNWEIVNDKTKVENIYSVGEAEIKAAMTLILEELKIIAEPSGCVPLAVVLFDPEFRKMVAERQAKTHSEYWDVAIVISGGNTTVDTIAALSGCR